MNNQPHRRLSLSDLWRRPLVQARAARRAEFVALGFAVPLWAGVPKQPRLLRRRDGLRYRVVRGRG